MLRQLSSSWGGEEHVLSVLFPFGKRPRRANKISHIRDWKSGVEKETFNVDIMFAFTYLGQYIHLVEMCPVF